MSNYNPTPLKSRLTGKPFDLHQKYALLSDLLGLGGVVVEVSNLYSERSNNSLPDAGADADASGTLSKAHISPSQSLHIAPFVEYRAGASLLKSYKGGEKEPQIGGGIRGGIQGFSAAARRRLLYTVQSVRRDAELPLFITLTYPRDFPDPKTSKRHLDTFFKRMARALPSHGTIWKLEPQQRGAPHYHLLTWGLSLEVARKFVPYAWTDIASDGDEIHLMWHEGELGNGNVHCVQQVYSRNGVLRYASKYLGKTFDVAGWDDQWTGRFWGIVNRGNIPFGELVQKEVSESQAVTVNRYQRRFSGLKRRNNKALTIFCDADQWIEKLKLNK